MYMSELDNELFGNIEPENESDKDSSGEVSTTEDSNELELDQESDIDIQSLIPESLEDRIETKVLEETMKSSYLTYAMSVIVSRALPDVRDGMKPVHRRIIYTMHKLGLTPGSKYKKCALVVGEVLGKYHPHGDQSVYNALARLAQDFSVRYPLIDGQGNFGSVDGDSPAAMRYTESRMDKPTPYIVGDIEKNTVDFVDNYDGSFKEPKVLPTLFPNLLVNGQTGIAVGMATEIPPHNLNEVCAALVHLLDNPEATIDELCEYIKGPDFPTGGTLYGTEAMRNAYKTGRGKAVLRSKAELQENRIVITEIPYQVNKSDLLIRIADLVKDKKILGVKDIRDESNKDGIRVVIDCKRDGSPEVILNQLYKQSDLQVNAHFNLLALVNDGRQPKLLNLKEILVEFLLHRDVVVTRRTQFDLDKTESELHILDGLKIALDFIDEVIKLIRSSYDRDEAAKKLQERFKLSEKQTDAILNMRLQTLTNLDKSKIEDERDVKIALIAELRAILEKPGVKQSLIRNEIEELSGKFREGRRTQIIDQNVTEYNKEDFVVEEDVLIQLTKEQYIKVLPVTTFRMQGRGGRGVSSFNPKDKDYICSSQVANSHDYVYAFTNKGRVFKTRVFELPQGARTGRGQALINYLELQEAEKITNILTITKEMEDDKEGSLVFITRKGVVKRTNLSQFQNVRRTGIIAIGLNDGDEVMEVSQSDNSEDKIILSSDNGKTVIFDRTQLNPMGRSAKGVRGMRLKGDDKIISLEIDSFSFGSSDDKDDSNTKSAQSLTLAYPSLLIITENGYGKQTELADFRKTNRGASGVKTLNKTKKTGKPVLIQILYGTESNLIVTTKKGVTINIDPEKISQLGRNTQGVKIINLQAGDEVVSGSVY
jgi:DNA gyrase subunit A